MVSERVDLQGYGLKILSFLMAIPCIFSCLIACHERWIGLLPGHCNTMTTTIISSADIFLQLSSNILTASLQILWQGFPERHSLGRVVDFDS